MIASVTMLPNLLSCIWQTIYRLRRFATTSRQLGSLVRIRNTQPLCSRWLPGWACPNLTLHTFGRLQGGIELSPRVRTLLEWIVDRAETAVLLAFIVVVLYAFRSMSWRLLLAGSRRSLIGRRFSSKELEDRQAAHNHHGSGEHEWHRLTRLITPGKQKRKYTCTK